MTCLFISSFYFLLIKLFRAICPYQVLCNEVSWYYLSQITWGSFKRDLLCHNRGEKSRKNVVASQLSTQGTLLLNRERQEGFISAWDFQLCTWSAQISPAGGNGLMFEPPSSFFPLQSPDGVLPTNTYQTSWKSELRVCRASPLV